MLSTLGKTGLTALALLMMACPADDGEEQNMLPTGTADDDGSGDGGPSSSDDGVDSGTAGSAVTFPRTYRFGCVDIQVLGDADGTAIQANLLETVWSSDIMNHKLNIMLTVASRDDATGGAELIVGSGIGTSDDDLCSEGSSESAVFPATFQAGTAALSPSSENKVCSMPAPAGEAAAGTYTLSLGPDDIVYVYAQDTDGTVFNCTEDPGVPDAVPVRAVEATVTVNPNETQGYGVLTGCLRQDEAMSLCSCLGPCMGGSSPECGGCPDGSRPLAALLQGINPSERCTTTMGVDAYDLTLGFTTTLLDAVPEACG